MTDENSVETPAPPKNDAQPNTTAEGSGVSGERKRGIAAVKKEFLHEQPPIDSAEGDGTTRTAKRQKVRGQNHGRRHTTSRDEKFLCSTRANAPEFSPGTCRFEEKCRFEHDLRKYLTQYKREDMTLFGGVCPIYDKNGDCPAGWKCRFIASHSKEIEHEDGKKELVLLQDQEKVEKRKSQILVSDVGLDGMSNVIEWKDRALLQKKQFDFSKSEAYAKWIEETTRQLEKNLHSRTRTEESATEHKTDDPKDEAKNEAEDITKGEGQVEAKDENKIGGKEEEKTNVERGDEGKVEGKDESKVEEEQKETTKDQHAEYKEPPFLPSEKRRLYFGPETPVLAPLTTQGNLPFRRLCVELGAQCTYSEMAMSFPVFQGARSEWALMKCHETEINPPTINPQRQQTIVQDYDHSRDSKFGVQISAAKPWQAIKATQALTTFCPHLRVVDLNCGCPIDLVYREGAGSALLNHGGKLEKMLHGMNAVSGEVPISLKIRTGTKDSHPLAHKLLERIIYGGLESQEIGQGGAGVAAITLHGRSRQQRYTRSADWTYIAECAALIKRLQKSSDSIIDTNKEVDGRFNPASGKPFFLGNGDCYSHVDYFNAVENAGVDSVMIARGALIKPWIFEEIQAGQYLDKSASERLQLVEKYVKYGLETWGSDEMGLGTTRRFLLEWLNFTHRYVPIGVLEHLPPRIQDRPPAWKGRNELETLMASESYKDWLKITEMFLGPTPPDFRFDPKHKSNAYDAEAEG